MNTKSILTTITLMVIVAVSFGQQSSKLEVSAYCPVPFGGNYINNAFKGYAGFSGTWLMESNKSFQYGAHIEMEYLYRSEFDIPLYMIAAGPVVSYEYKVSDKLSLIPQFSLGYAPIVHMYPEISLTDNPEEINYTGKNEARFYHGVFMGGNCKVVYSLTTKLGFFANLGYRFTRIFNNEVLDHKYNKNSRMFQPGLGVQFKL